MGSSVVTLPDRELVFFKHDIISTPFNLSCTQKQSDGGLCSNGRTNRLLLCRRRSGTYFQLQLSEQHLIRGAEALHDEVIQPVDKDDDDGDGKHGKEPKDGLLIGLVGHVEVIPFAHRHEQKVQEHTQHGDEHSQDVGICPLVVEEGHLGLQGHAEADEDDGSRHIQTEIVEGGGQHEVAQKANNNSIDDGIEDPLCDGFDLQQLVRATGTVHLRMRQHEVRLEISVQDAVEDDRQAEDEVESCVDPGFVQRSAGDCRVIAASIG